MLVFFLGSDADEESTAPEPPSNIVTSWGASKPTRAPGQTQKNVPAQPRRYNALLQFET